MLGAGDSTLRFCPPLVISRDQCDFAVDTLEECLTLAGANGLRTLDVGCGIHKQPGAIGIDRNPASRADVLADLDRFPYPFADSAFDRLTAIHVIEHVARRDPHHGGVPPPGPPRRHRAHRDPALHRFQLVLRPHAQEPPEQLQLPLFRRESWRLRLLFEGQISRDFRPPEATGFLALARVRVPGQPLSRDTAGFGNTISVTWCAAK